jgi:retrograde regulation protein 2
MFFSGMDPKSRRESSLVTVTKAYAPVSTQELVAALCHAFRAPPSGNQGVVFDYSLLTAFVQGMYAHMANVKDLRGGAALRSTTTGEELHVRIE